MPYIQQDWFQGYQLIAWGYQLIPWAIDYSPYQVCIVYYLPQPWLIAYIDNDSFLKQCESDTKCYSSVCS